MGEVMKSKLFIEGLGGRREVVSPVEPESVGSEEVKDGSIKLEDLSQEVREMIEAGGLSADVIVPVAEELTSLSPEPDRYYRLDALVNTLAVTLPEMQSDTKLRRIGMFFSTGSMPDVTVHSGAGQPVNYAEDYHIEPNRSYELSARWNGLKWVVSLMMLVGWFLFVSPNAVQWLAPDGAITYNISTNTSWELEY